MAKNSKRAFISAMRAKGGLRYYDSGGPVDLTRGVTPPTGAPGTQQQGGIGGFLTPQNGYSAVLAPTTQLNYTPVVNAAANNALAAQGTYNQNLGNENALENTLVQQSQGAGPNPAQSQLNQATGQNINNQAALMASQRGAGANAGLIARQAAQQGAQVQQNATGQAATLNAEQRLAQEQQAAGLQGQIGAQAISNQGVNNNLFGTAAGANNTQNANLISNYGQQQGINAATSQANAQASQSTTGGILGGIGSAIGSIFGFADGGEVGEVAPNTYASSYVGKFLMGGENAPSSSQSSNQGMSSMGSALGSNVKSILQPQGAANIAPAGASDLPDMSMMAANGGKIPKKPVTTPELAAKGESVPGKASIKGDNLKNDKVPAMLSPGEIVLPRSVTQSPDAPKKAMNFVMAIQAKQGHKRGKK